MYCRNCGRPLEPTEESCASCGLSTSQPPAAAPSAAATRSWGYVRAGLLIEFAWTVAFMVMGLAYAVVVGLEAGFGADSAGKVSELAESLMSTAFPRLSNTLTLVALGLLWFVPGEPKMKATATLAFVLTLGVAVFESAGAEILGGVAAIASVAVIAYYCALLGDRVRDEKLSRSARRLIYFIASIALIALILVWIPELIGGEGVGDGEGRGDVFFMFVFAVVATALVMSMIAGFLWYLRILNSAQQIALRQSEGSGYATSVAA